METLSDNICDGYEEYDFPVIPVRCIKKFIKDIMDAASYEKEPQLQSIDDSLVWMGGMKSGWYQAMSIIRQKIEKLSGDVLVGEGVA